MFYGTVPGSEQFRLVATAVLECCKEVVDESNLKREQYLTFGMWHLKDVLPVINLCFNERCTQVNAGLQRNIINFTKELRSKMSTDRVDFVIKYYQFLSELSCKLHATEQQYFITTAFITTMKVYYGEEFNGVLYPSSMTGMEGLNVVLTPEAVEKYFVLKQAFMYKLAREPNDPKAYKAYQASNIADVVNKKFNFTAIY